MTEFMLAGAQLAGSVLVGVLRCAEGVLARVRGERGVELRMARPPRGRWICVSGQLDWWRTWRWEAQVGLRLISQLDPPPTPNPNQRPPSAGSQSRAAR